jgi:DNA-directed RNA polymerase subunit H (RpoH/RPB5)
LYDPFIVAPTHRLLKKNEYPIKTKEEWNNMPKILESDIISKYFNAKENQIFEIGSDIGSEYRIVTKDI